jgi:redox-sensitive bicupin YhaK (pirin superfamily)
MLAKSSILTGKALAPGRGLFKAAFTAAFVSIGASALSTTCSVMSPPSIKVVASDRLYVSEPDPRMFGNGPNPQSDPAWTNKNWLKSRFHFSFAEYSSASNTNFGALRVMNDDLVQPHRGFGTHPHSNMEIITYIVDGELTHQDSMGTKESLGRGSIQFMTAGKGLRHSEFNHGDKPLRFIQTWIQPDDFGLTPNYGSYQGSADARKNTLQHLVSDVSNKSTSTPVKIHQDVDAYAAELDLGGKVELDLAPGRQAYLLCIEGAVKVNGEQLNRHDGCEIVAKEGGTVEIEATETEETENGKVAHILVFAMKHVPGSGRKDL